MRFPRRSKRYWSRGLPRKYWSETIDRQELVAGSSFTKNQSARLLVNGAGGIGANFIQSAARKGYRYFENLDDDWVEYSNLPRQPYSPRDVGRYKVFALGKNVVRNALFPVTVYARPFRFQELYSVDQPLKQSFDLIIAGVDNNPTRRAITKFGLAHHIPVIHAAVSRDANSLYTFVQQPGQACWACAFPEYLDDATYPCALPAVVDALNLTTGFMLHAADSLVSDRPREWNHVHLYLDGGLPSSSRFIQKRPDCPLCYELNGAPQT